MAINIANLNVRGLRSREKTDRLLKDLLDLKVDVAAIEETHFVRPVDSRVLANDYYVVSDYGNNVSRGVSLLVRCALNPRIDIVHRSRVGRAIVADVAIRDFTFRVVAAYAPNIRGERVSFFRGLEQFLNYPGRLVAVGDWNAILDPKIDRGCLGRDGRCEKSLIDLMERSDLVDRYRIDHPGEEMWTYTRSSPFIQTYLDRVLVRRADVDFVSCPTFHWWEHSDHKLVVTRLSARDRPKLAGYWKLNSSLLESKDFRDELEGFIRGQLVGVGSIGSRRWVKFKADLRTFSIRYSQRLALIKARERRSREALINRVVVGGSTLDARLARQDLERAATERYQGQIVRGRLNRVPNEAAYVDNAERHEEHRWFCDRYMKSVKNLDGRMLRGTTEIVEGFRGQFEDLFTATELPEELWGDYLADFPRLGENEAASCEGIVTEAEVIRALRQVKPGKAPGLDGLPYELYLRQSHLFVPILTGLYNHWFSLGHIPDQVTKGVITLVKKKGKTGEGVDDYRPITLLNTELKILAKILANRLREVLDDLIGPEQTYAMRGRSIKSNLHLMREVLEGIDEDDEAALISLDQSKAFDRVNHRFLFRVLGAAGFQPDLCKWIGLLYERPKTVVQINGKRSRPFKITRSVRQGCPLSPLLYILTLEPLLRRLRDERSRPALCGIALPGGRHAKDSAYADDVTVYVSSLTDIVVTSNKVKYHCKLTGAEINCTKSEGLLLGKWRRQRSNAPPPNFFFKWSNGPIEILGFWVGPDLQVERNWSAVSTKVAAAVWIWSRRKLSVKGRAQACSMYVFPIILYYLSILPLPGRILSGLTRSLFRVLWRWGHPHVRRETCIQRLVHGGLGMPCLKAHRDAERLSFLSRTLTEDADTPWGRKVRANFPELDTQPGAEGLRMPRGECTFLRECRSAIRRFPRSLDLTKSRKALYRELVEGSAQDRFRERLGLTEVDSRSIWSWAPGTGYFTNAEFSLTWRVARNGLWLNDKSCMAWQRMFPNCTRCRTGEEETVVHAFYKCPKVRALWDYVNEVIARIVPDQLFQLDTSYVIDNLAPPWSLRRNRLLFALILAVARMVVWTSRMEECFDDQTVSAQDLVRYFKHQLRVKIRCDWNRLPISVFRERWTNDVSLVLWQGDSWYVRLPP